MPKKPVHDPDTGEIIEWLDNSPEEPWADAQQQALDRRLVKWTGEYDGRGRAIYERTDIEGRG